MNGKIHFPGPPPPRFSNPPRFVAGSPIHPGSSAIKNSLYFLTMITALLTYAAVSVALVVVLVAVGIGMEMGGTPRLTSHFLFSLALIVGHNTVNAVLVHD